jgi:hypothetical protein
MLGDTEVVPKQSILGLIDHRIAKPPQSFLIFVRAQELVTPLLFFVTSRRRYIDSRSAKCGAPKSEKKDCADPSGDQQTILSPRHGKPDQNAENRTCTMGDVGHRHDFCESGNDAKEEPDDKQLNCLRIDGVAKALVVSREHP